MSETFHDFIRPGEDALYAELDQSLRKELAPVGVLENTLFDEIRRATWRLRRCGLIEGSLAASGSEDLSKIQSAVDKARTQAHRLLRQCTAELRKLQTDRQYRIESFAPETDLSESGLADYRAIRKGLDQQFRADYHRRKFTGMAEIDAFLSIPIRPPNSFCKTPDATTAAFAGDAAA
jgi:hypothetical protein